MGSSFYVKVKTFKSHFTKNIYCFGTNKLTYIKLQLRDSTISFWACNFQPTAKITQNLSGRNLKARLKLRLTVDKSVFALLQNANEVASWVTRLKDTVFHCRPVEKIPFMLCKLYPMLSFMVLLGRQ